VQKNVFNSGDLLDKESLNSAEALLEYKFANAIQKLTEKETPVIAYAYGNGEPPFGWPNSNDVFKTLGQNFIADTVNIKNVPFIPNEFNVLLFVKPVFKFTDDDKFKIDQYVMNGGKVLFFMDVLYADRDSLKNTDAQVAYARDLEISDLLFKYGLRINNDLLIDSHCDKLPITVGNVGGKPQIQLLPFPYYPLAQPGSQHPIVKNMADVVMQFPNSIDTIFTEGVQQTVLLASSTTATTEPTPAQIDINRLQHEENVTKLNKKNIPLAVLSEGKFSSAYALRATQAQEDSLKSYGRDIMRQCTVSNSIILVSDAEMILNDYSDVAGPLPMGMNKFTKIQYANREFFLNCLEYLGNPNSILEARAKDYGLRLLDQKMLAEDKSTWQVINIAAPVLLVCIFGFIYQWWRKRKYTK
jgi:gliding-associated putative ABC transporter substrate-binding component GldG